MRVSRVISHNDGLGELCARSVPAEALGAGVSFAELMLQKHLKAAISLKQSYFCDLFPLLSASIKAQPYQMLHQRLS